MVAGVLRVRALRRALALAAVCGSRLCAGAAAEPRLPPDISVADTAQLLRINGVEARARALTSDLTPEAVCALLARQWLVRGAAGPPVQCQRIGGWFVITHQAGKVLQTAQFEATGHGSVGFLSEVDPFAIPSGRPRAQLPLPAGARIQNVVQSIEAGDSVTQFTLSVPLPPAVALMKLRMAARERGWEWAQADSGGVIDFQRGAVAVRAIAARTPLGTGLVLVEHQAAGQ